MRKKDENKERAIMEAAITVFAQHGYHDAKIHKIAEIAGVATGSIYSYYENKMKILLAIFDNVWKKLYNDVEQLELAGNMPAEERFDAMLDLIFDLFVEKPDLTMVFVQEENFLLRTHREEFTPYFDKFFARGESIVAEGVKQNTFRKEVNIPLFRMFLMAGASALLQTWVQDPEAYPLTEIRTQIKTYAKYGIRLGAG